MKKDFKNKSKKQYTFSTNNQAEGFAARPGPRQKLNPTRVISFFVFLTAIVTSVYYTMHPATAPAAPTAEMPVPILEIRKPSPEDQSEMEVAEEKLLREVTKLPADSPALFGLYGEFAVSCQERGVYAKAEKYFKKGFALGPKAYKTYDFSKHGDFELNYISMLVDIGRLDDSAKFAESLFDQQTQVLGPLNDRTLDTGVALARGLGYISKPKEKGALSQKLITMLETNGKEKSDDWVQLMICLGESHQALNEMHEAKVCYEKALAVAQRLPNESLTVDNVKQTVAQFASIK